MLVDRPIEKFLFPRTGMCNERLSASKVPRSQVVMISSYRFRTASKAQKELLVGHSRETELIPDVRLESINLFSMLFGLIAASIEP
jgi:hypothetical protein